MSEEFNREHQQELERRKQMRAAMRRKQQWTRRIFWAALAAAAILIILLIARSCSAKKEKEATESAHRAITEVAQSEIVTTKASLAAVGDIMCYTEQMNAALTDSGSYDFAPALAAVSPYLQSADLTVGNLELNFCGKDAGYMGKPNFNAPESLAANLSGAGFDILQTANTYSLQNGLNGLISTVKYLTEQNLDHVGTYYSAEEKESNGGVIFKTVNGIKFAFFAYTKGINNMTLPENAEYCTDVLYRDYNSNYEEINSAALLHSIETAKNGNADVIIAMLHWGSEFEVEPSESQNKIADLLFQNGVDVILGSHSHEIGPMELRTVEVDGEEKQVFIAYSLGNFLSSMEQEETKASCVLNLEFSMDIETGKTGISNVNYLPLYLCDKGENAETRYETLPIRSALTSGLFEAQSQAMNDALKALKEHTGSDLDCGK